MRLKLPHSLHYPITVTELQKQPGENVERFAPLFTYTYKTKVTETDESGEEKEVEREYPTRFESNVEGTLKKWVIRKGDIIYRPGSEVAEIEEPCAHSVQYGGLCATCGKDMTEFSYVTTQPDARRANISMIHNDTALTVSEEEANRVEDEAKRRLIAAKKLSLVVDLDQTIIHATVDPTVGEWQKDPDNPNYEALKDVQKFQLVDDGPGGRGTWYYIKLRPGLAQFLENISKYYELHIYTMGTRAYAENIAQLVDPHQKIFGGRILSRDESGSMVAKNLQRLFPVDTKMVVIIDDRGDVWNYNANLIKVTAFSFFIGIGDINGTFLPKRPRVRATPKPTLDEAAKTNGEAESSEESAGAGASTDEEKQNGEVETKEEGISALEQLVSMGGGDDPNVLQEQNAKQDELLTAQLQDRPLLQKQKELDAEDESESDSEKPRPHVLNEDDNELVYLEQSLRKVHTEFFDAYSRNLADASGGRLAALRGAQPTGKKKIGPNADLELVPDIKTVMPMVKSRVLEGVTLVFSGVIPLGADLDSSEIVIWARSFGAKVQEDISGRTTTHLVAVRNRTSKVRRAVRRGKGRIKVVNLHWLLDSIVQWRKLDEGPYRLKTGQQDLGKPFPDEDLGEVEEEAGDGGVLSESDSGGNTPVELDETVETIERPMGGTTGGGLAVPKGIGRLRIKTKYETEDESDVEGLMPSTVQDEHSPVGGTNDDWNDMHNEMQEFLGSDDDEEGYDDGDDDDDEPDDGDDTASRGSRASRSGPRPFKRSHAEVTASDSEDGAVQRKKLARSTSGVSVGGGGGSGGSGGPTSSGVNGNNGLLTPGMDDGRAGAGEESEHGWSDFDEDELEKEFERANQEDMMEDEPTAADTKE